MTYPLILLSHRRREFLDGTLASIREHLTGCSEVTIVDDSGDAEHRAWLAAQGHHVAPVAPANAGYLTAMSVVFAVAREACDRLGVDYALLWEEDFRLNANLDAADMARILDANPRLAQLNLQRQAVYKIERRFGYMMSHRRRGYGLKVNVTNGISWVSRLRPFTTNPGMIRRAVLDHEWPSREESDLVRGHAEPAMSLRLEVAGWTFGWFGRWDTPHAEHVGMAMKSGTGY